MDRKHPIRQSLAVFALCAIFIYPSSIHAATTTQITQYGITWTFAAPAEFGTYANGDYWVVGPVTITSITPNWDGQRNGWAVNPRHDGNQAMDSRLEDFDASIAKTLPYQAAPGSSILKMVSDLDGPCATFSFDCFITAGVLTVVASIPPGRGERYFRPPFMALDKPMYSVDDLRLDKLPAYPRLENCRPLSWIERRFQRPQTDFQFGRKGRSYRAQENYPGPSSYGSDIGDDLAEGALNLMLDDPIEAKMNALINYVQGGIDAIYEAKDGRAWTGAGAGIEPGFRAPLLFAAAMLNKPELVDFVKNYKGFSEFRSISPYRPNPTRALYGGESNYVTEKEYWEYLIAFDTNKNPSANSRKDPYGFVDAELPKIAYQTCCFANPWKGNALLAHMFPEVKAIFNNNLFLEYVDRWVTVGTWMQPDPCAPHDGSIANYGKTFGPDPKRPDMCILDTDLAYYNSPSDFKCKPGLNCGRYPNMHGLNKNGGHYGRASITDLWKEYRGVINVPLPPPQSDVDNKSRFEVFKNVFNPFRGEEIKIKYTIGTDAKGPISLLIFSQTGQEIKRFSLNESASQTNEVIWDGRNSQGSIVASGMYTLNLKIGEKNVTDKIIVIK